jgi:hypothetical protein
MSIRREQEHVSSALTAVVEIPRHTGALFKAAMRRATEDVTITISGFFRAGGSPCFCCGAVRFIRAA